MLLHTGETVSGRVISGRAVSHVTEGLGRELDATAARERPCYPFIAASACDRFSLHCSALDGSMSCSL